VIDVAVILNPASGSAGRDTRPSGSSSSSPKGELELFLVSETTVETRRRRLQVSLDGELAVLASPLEYRVLAMALPVMGL
jgi:diacylglycerol kinase family enzyme